MLGRKNKENSVSWWKMRTINISEEGFLKFMKIHATREQDSSRAQTFDHIMYVYEEQQFKPKKIIVQGEPMHIIAGNASSPIIDADQLQVVRKKP